MSKNEIIASIRKNKPSLIELELPDYQQFREDIDTVSLFKQQVNEAGGSVIECNRGDIEKILSDNYQNASEVYSLIDEFKPLDNRSADDEPSEYKNLDLVVLNGKFGVAENGAIWVPDSNLSQRIIPFITRNLVLVVIQESLVANMHDAYAEIGNFSEGFGVFIAGPSKTADIEQSLVIGAQGALSLTVLLVSD